MNYTNSSNRLHVPVRADLSAKPATFLSLETSARGVHLRVRTAATLARRKAGAFKLAAAAVVALCVAPFARQAAAQMYFIQPTTEATSKDAKIYSSTPTMNFQSNLNLTSPDTGAFFSSLVQFNLGSVPANTTITRATLTLYCTGLGASGASAVGGTVSVQPITSGWSETTDDAAVAGAPPLATYNAVFGAPPTITLGNVVASTVVNGAGFITWDITGTAQQWLNGSLANNGVFLRLSTNGADVGFADVDSSTVAGSQPSLTLVVPEPSTTAATLAGVGGLALTVFRRRRLV